MSEPAPQPAEIYLQLRSRLFSLNPQDVGIEPSTEVPHVWGVIMEMGYEVGTATLISMADGTTSLYYSTGGGLLGSGDYTPIAETAKSLVAEAEKYIEKLEPTGDYPLPLAGEIRFILLTFTGRLAASAPSQEVASGTHLLSPLFVRAQNALDQLRLLTEKKK